MLKIGGDTTDRGLHYLHKLSNSRRQEGINLSRERVRAVKPVACVGGRGRSLVYFSLWNEDSDVSLSHWCHKLDGSRCMDDGNAKEESSCSLQV